MAAMIINGNVILSNGEMIPPIRIVLWDGQGDHGQIFETMSTPDGMFQMHIPEPYNNMIIDGAIMPEYRVMYNETVVHQQTIPYEEGQEIQLIVDEQQYHNAVDGGGDTELIINGQLTLSDGGDIQPLTVQLWDANGTYGMVREVVSEQGGSFNIHITEPHSSYILSGELVPQYRIFYQDVELLSVEVPYNAGEEIDMEIDAGTYNSAIGGEEPGSAEFLAVVQDIANVRVAKENLYNNILSVTEQLKNEEGLLSIAIDRGFDNVAVLQGNIDGYLTTLTDLKGDYATLIDQEQVHIDRLYEYFPFHGQAVGQMDDRVPILFFPVRIETVFRANGDNPELWVRIFPDDIAVDTHEQQLTEDEKTAGEAYWASYAAASGDEPQILQAWDVLSRGFTAQRAAWIALQTMPSNPAQPTKLYPWGKQPVSKIMPDRFVIIGYSTNNYSSPAFSVQTNLIPDILAMGIDPSIPDDPNNPNNETFVQDNGDIITPHNDVDWMVDFDAAIAKGLGKKIAITTEQFNQGFDRIIVLGVKASLNKDLSQKRLEELIDAHHYTDGFSLLKQGTSTSNTDTEYSGYSSVDFGNPTTYATERKNQLFTPVPNNNGKSDGQMLCEALGIEYETLYHIYHSNGYDIRDSMNINNALFQVAVGYFVGDMLHPLVTRTRVDELRDFFADYVRARGALPSIRSGIQPYGILPASAYSRINWRTDVYKDLYSDIRWLTATLSQHWDNAVTAIAPDGYIVTAGENPNQSVVDFLARPPLSQGRIQRLGFGPGYVWNNLVYASPEEPNRPQEWLNNQYQRMNQLQDESGLPLNPRPRIAQFNFLEEQMQVTRPLVASENTPKNQPLPSLGGSDKNYLSLIADASFAQLRDENYNDLGVPDGEIPNAQLYQFTRQSLMLEYFDAACKLLGIPDDQRIEPELINIVHPSDGGEGNEYQTNENFGLYTGGSRWAVMDTPYAGFPTVGDFLSSEAASGNEQAFYLIRAKNSIRELSFNAVGELEMLATEVMDAACYRLDTWVLALVNQRINAVRGITDGSLNRGKGIYLGAYGWVENVRNRGPRTYMQQPPTSNFSLPIEIDSSNKGFMQAPSIAQAATAAVLRSGYINNGASSPTSPFSVNISSERTRYALEILDGIRNGQELAVLLGYEFERRLHDNYPPNPGVLETDKHIVSIREKYYLLNKINTITTEGTEAVKARNVTNGITLVNDYRAGVPFTNFLNTLVLTTPERNAILAEAAWISNLMDAVGDLTAAESIFQLVQGNQQRSSAMTDAIARGTNIPEIEHINTPKTGLTINQKLTMHFELDTDGPDGWENATASRRATAEPYMNRWIGQLLGDPALIKFRVINRSQGDDDITLSIADLNIQPIDLAYIITDELNTDDSELAVRIKRYLRGGTSSWAARTDVLEIEYDPLTTTPDVNLADILPILRYLKRVIANSRPLKTLDYVPSLQANEAPQEIMNEYQLVDIYTRMNAAFTEFNNAYNDLDTQLASFTSPSATNFGLIRQHLERLNQFGLTQTLYEFKEDTEADYEVLKEYASSVVKEAEKRLKQYNAAKPDDPVVNQPTTASDIDKFINDTFQAVKALFGREFTILPMFKIQATDSTMLQNVLTSNYGSLLNDHKTPVAPVTNHYLMDEWLSGIAKIKKNAADFELLTVLTSAINPDVFDGDRTLAPLQLPYSNDGSDRWLGASVADQESIKVGRTAFGVSLPTTSGVHDITDWQVGILIEEWTDVVPSMEETTGIAFHFNQPNSKPPQCLLLGLTPDITGNWLWDDLVDMINETFTLAKTRAITYEELSATPVAQLAPGIMVPFSTNYATIGFATADLQP